MFVFVSGHTIGILLYAWYCKTKRPMTSCFRELFLAGGSTIDSILISIRNQHRRNTKSEACHSVLCPVLSSATLHPVSRSFRLSRSFPNNNKQTLNSLLPSLVVLTLALACSVTEKVGPTAT